MTTVSFGQEAKLNDIQNEQYRTHAPKGTIYIVDDKIHLDTSSATNDKLITVIKVDGDVHIVGTKAINTATEIKNIFIFIFLFLIFIYICTHKKI